MSLGGFSADLNSYSDTITDVQKSTWDFLMRRHTAYFVFGFVVPICMSIAIGYSEITASGAILFTPLPLVIPISLYWWVYSRMKKLFYTNLATELGCTYSETGVVPTSGHLFTFGHSHTVRNMLSGTYKDFLFHLFDYSYVVGSGKERHTYYFTVAELTVVGTLPKVLCIPDGWNFVSFIDTWKPEDYTPLSLEGGFNNKFNVYVAKDREMEALQILEPNVMEKLMDGFDTFGFECLDSRVYLFTKGAGKDNRESVLSAFSLTKRFCDLLLPELQSFLRN